MMMAVEQPAHSRAQTSAADASKPTPVFWAAQFSDSVGTNIHLHHRKSVYITRFALLKERLLAARIKHVRDGALDQRGGFAKGDRTELYREFGNAGIGVTFILRVGVSKEFVQGYPVRVYPAFEAYELPNELNIQRKVPISWPTTVTMVTDPMGC